MGRKFNGLMFVFSLIGGIIGYFVGEVVLSQLLYRIPDSLLMGIYFGQFAFFVGMMCLIAEIISPKLNGMNWRRMYAGYSWKLWVPCTLVMLFLLGTLFQFIYGLNFGDGKKINDIVMLVDTSESMTQTDPQNKRFDAVKSLMDNMEPDNRISVFIFNDNVTNVQPMSAITSGIKSDILNKLSDYRVPAGRTNMRGALQSAVEHIRDSKVPDKSSMVILLSDGGDNYNLAGLFAETVEPYKKDFIPIFTVGMAGSDELLLNGLSNATGGKYYSVNDTGNLGDTFNKIYNEKDLRLLVGERNGLTSSSLLYVILRIFFLMLIGLLLGFGIGLMFDNRYIAKGLAIGGGVSGIIAGLVLELGFSGSILSGTYIRLIADVILACIFTIFSLMVSQGENTRLTGGHYSSNTGNANANSFGIDRNSDRRSF